MDFGVDEKRLIIEIIANLTHLKNDLVNFILKPAGLTPDSYSSYLYKLDEVTGRILSKRKIAPLIIEAIEQKSDSFEIFKKIIEIAARWDKFHLAKDEFTARATVQKAREVLGDIEAEKLRQFELREKEKKEENKRIERERLETLRKESELLLMMFDELTRSDDPHSRGYLLQDLMNRVFDIHSIPVIKSFTRNEGGEQIDGAFKLEGWHYLVECRWRKKLADIRELDGLIGQVGRSGRQTMGFFLSINGWSANVPLLLKQNPQKFIIMMDGYDLRCVLSQSVDFQKFLSSKIETLNLKGEPYYGALKYMEEVESL
jgi:hypothetical protein